MGMIPAFAFLVAALATARLTRLITTDYLTAGPRARIVNWAGTSSKLAYLITCQWCASIWVAAAVAPITYWWWHSAWVQIPAALLAYSQVAGLMSRGEVD